MSDSVQPHRRQPTRLRHPWDSPGKNTRVGCHSLEEFKGQFEQVEERTSKLENKTKEIIKSQEERRKKRLKKNGHQVDQRHIMAVQEGGERIEHTQYLNNGQQLPKLDKRHDMNVK